MKRVVAALILKNDQILACQRTRHQPMPLKWEFPGGKIEEGEQPRDALRRELEEELGIEAMIGNEDNAVGDWCSAENIGRYVAPTRSEPTSEWFRGCSPV